MRNLMKDVKKILPDNKSNTETPEDWINEINQIKNDEVDSFPVDTISKLKILSIHYC